MKWFNKIVTKWNIAIHQVLFHCDNWKCMADSQGSPDKTIKKELEKVRKLSDGVEQN